jgi:hypothetical protein
MDLLPAKIIAVNGSAILFPDYWYTNGALKKMPFSPEQTLYYAMIRNSPAAKCALKILYVLCSTEAIKYLFKGSVKTFILTENPKPSDDPNTAFAYIDFSENTFLPGLMNFFYGQQFLSVFVEGGAALVNTFLQQNLWDEARVFTSGTTFTNGIKAPDMPKHFLADTYMVKNDVLSVYRNI